MGSADGGNPDQAASTSQALIIPLDSSATQIVDPRELPLEERLQQAEEHDKKLRHVVEDIPIKIKHLSGSSAGAGSGEFHIYRKGRDWERKRVDAMEKEWRENQAKLLAKRAREAKEAALEARTEKHRNKRQKRKEKKLAKKASCHHADTDAAETGNASPTGSTIPVGAAAIAHRPAQQSIGADAAAAAAGDAEDID